MPEYMPMRPQKHFVVSARQAIYVLQENKRV